MRSKFFMVMAALLVVTAGCKAGKTDEQAQQQAAGEGAVQEKAKDMKAASDVNREELQRAADSFIQDYGVVVGGLYRDAGLAYWKAANTGDKAAFDEYAAKDLAARKYLSDPERFKRVQSFLKHKDLLTPVAARALKVIELSYQENQLPPEMLEKLVTKSSEIEMTFNTFRAEIDGKKYTNNDLLDVLSKEKDSAKRQQAWEALKQVGARVGPMLLDLARVRNQAAVMLGFRNFWDMRMRLQDHDPDMVLALFNDLKAKTDKPFADMKAGLDAELSQTFAVPVDKLMPWHYDNPFFQAAPPSPTLDLDIFYKDKTKEDIVAIGQKFFQDIGIPIDEIVANSDFYEREGKDQHAFCTDIDRAGDVRMLLNVKPTQEWMDTMLHESGHSAYSKYNDPTLPWAVRDAAHIFTTEGIAMLLGALAKNPTWLKAYAGADSATVDRFAPELARQRQREQLIFARWAMVMFFFEHDLYENPDRADLNKLWYDHVEALQGLTRPEGRDLPDWAAKPHFTIAPVYYHNYLLGELFASMLRQKLASMGGHQGPASTLDFVGRKDFGTYIVDSIFKPGMAKPWPDFVKEAFGVPFSPDAFVSEVQ